MKIGPRYKICKRLGERVFSKCQTTKFSISGQGAGAAQRPASGGGRRGRTGGDYGRELIEKQKVRFSYGVSEHQFARYVKLARSKMGQAPDSTLYEALERRLDNVVYRLGLAPSRLAARQMVSHGHFLVNGRRLNVPSHTVKVGDTVTVRMGSRSKVPFQTRTEEKEKGLPPPLWLNLAENGVEAKVAARPPYGEREANLNFSSIISFYSRV